jgi:ferrous iron transport protein B
MRTDSILENATRLRGELPEGFGDDVVASIFDDAERIVRHSVTSDSQPARLAMDQVLDRALTHRVWGFVVMGALFFGVFWFTILGAALPSDLLYVLLVDKGHSSLRALFVDLGATPWVTGLLVDGVYLGTAWVVAVMLPPMAICRGSRSTSTGCSPRPGPMATSR